MLRWCAYNNSFDVGQKYLCDVGKDFFVEADLRQRMKRIRCGDSPRITRRRLEALTTFEPAAGMPGECASLARSMQWKRWCCADEARSDETREHARSSVGRSWRKPQMWSQISRMWRATFIVPEEVDRGKAMRWQFAGSRWHRQI
jgi:hypothetical protein